MKTLPKIFLAASVTGFVAGGIIDFSQFNLNPSWTVSLPVGAVTFGLFLISFMLEKEMAKFDEEEAMKLQLIGRNLTGRVARQKQLVQGQNISRSVPATAA